MSPLVKGRTIALSIYKAIKGSGTEKFIKYGIKFCGLYAANLLKIDYFCVIAFFQTITTYL